MLCKVPIYTQFQGMFAIAIGHSVNVSGLTLAMDSVSVCTYHIASYRSSVHSH